MASVFAAIICAQNQKTPNRNKKKSSQDPVYQIDAPQQTSKLILSSDDDDDDLPVGKFAGLKVGASQRHIKRQRKRARQMIAMSTDDLLKGMTDESCEWALTKEGTPSLRQIRESLSASSMKELVELRNRLGPSSSSSTKEYESREALVNALENILFVVNTLWANQRRKIRFDLPPDHEQRRANRLAKWAIKRWKHLVDLKQRENARAKVLQRRRERKQAAAASTTEKKTKLQIGRRSQQREQIMFDDSDESSEYSSDDY
mmetsp:Transcript_15272/g.22855  ORF Transcript_15272/g.22855 Transcript_15272/m.22855 type:complete len:260 (-) Transcript_15272:41-820(-)